MPKGKFVPTDGQSKVIESFIYAVIYVYQNNKYYKRMIDNSVHAQIFYALNYSSTVAEMFIGRIIDDTYDMINMIVDPDWVSFLRNFSRQNIDKSVLVEFMRESAKTLVLKREYSIARQYADIALGCFNLKEYPDGMTIILFSTMSPEYAKIVYERMAQSNVETYRYIFYKFFIAQMASKVSRGNPDMQMVNFITSQNNRLNLVTIKIEKGYSILKASNSSYSLGVIKDKYSAQYYSSVITSSPNIISSDDELKGDKCYLASQDSIKSSEDILLSAKSGDSNYKFRVKNNYTHLRLFYETKCIDVDHTFGGQ